MVSTKAVSCYCHLLLPSSVPLHNSDQQCQFLHTIHTNMWESFHIVIPYVTYFSKTQTYTKISSRNDANICNVGNTFAIRTINSVPGQLTWNPRLVVSSPLLFITRHFIYIRHYELTLHNVSGCSRPVSAFLLLWLCSIRKKKRWSNSLNREGGLVNNSVKQELQDYCRSVRRHTDRMAKCRRHCYNMHVAKLATHDMDKYYWCGGPF
jgi:hypothetical protein